MKKLWLRVVGLGAACLGVVGTLAPAAGARAIDPLPPGAIGPYWLVNTASYRCLAAPRNAANGVRVGLETCTVGRTSQHWYLAQQPGPNSQWMLAVRDTHRCLDANWRGGNGQIVYMWDCFRAFDNPNQIWTILGTNPGVIKSLGRRVLDSPGPYISEPSPIHLWDDWGGHNQRWIIESADR